jgi:hypothetical protein
MPTSFTTNDLRVGDFLKWEVEERFTRVAAKIQNKTGAAIAAGAIVPGTPLNLNGSQWETINATAEAGIDGFFVDYRVHEALANNAITAKRYSILVRGPALIDKNAIPTSDLQASPVNYTLATIVTRCAALDIQVLAEPVTREQMSI